MLMRAASDAFHYTLIYSFIERRLLPALFQRYATGAAIIAADTIRPPLFHAAFHSCRHCSSAVKKKDIRDNVAATMIRPPPNVRRHQDAHGGVSVTSNVIPNAAADMTRANIMRDARSAMRLLLRRRLFTPPRSRQRRHAARRAREHALMSRHAPTTMPASPHVTDDKRPNVRPRTTPTCPRFIHYCSRSTKHATCPRVPRGTENRALYG